MEHRINLIPNASPVRQEPYRLHPDKIRCLNSQIDSLLAEGIIEESTSAWAAPILVVPKPDGTGRLCVDFGHLNAVTEPIPFPMPRQQPVKFRCRTRRKDDGPPGSAYWVCLAETCIQATFKLPIKLGFFAFADCKDFFTYPMWLLHRQERGFVGALFLLPKTLESSSAKVHLKVYPGFQTILYYSYTKDSSFPWLISVVDRSAIEVSMIHRIVDSLQHASPLA